jgi:beta-glucanase (GH16 family)
MNPLIITSVGNGDSIVTSAPGDNLVTGMAVPGSKVVIRRNKKKLGTAQVNQDGTFSYAFTQANLDLMGEGPNEITLRQVIQSDSFPFIVNTVAQPPALPVITLAAAPASVLEDGTTNLAYTFSRTGDTASPLTVNFTTAGTTTSGTDYAAIGNSITFLAGQGTATVIVDPTPDSIFEPDETVSLTLTANPAYIVGTAGPVTGTITNDDAAPAPGVFRDDFNGTTLDTSVWQVGTWQEHGGQTGTERVFVKDGCLNMMLVNDPSRGILSSTINTWKEFGFGKWEARLKPTAVRGVLNSFFTIDWDKLSTPNTPADGTKQEIDIEFLTNSFGSNYGEVHYAVHAEGRRSMNTNPDISLGFNPSDDFHVYGFDIRRDRIDWFVDGQIKYTYRYDENDITITAPYQLKLNTWTATNWIGGPPTPGVVATYQIDWIQFTPENSVVTPPVTPLPAVSLSVETEDVSEDGNANLIYTFTRTGDASAALTVNYTVGGTATIGTDYSGISAAGSTKTISFAPGAASAIVTVDPTADTTVESDESVTLSLAAGTGYTISTPGAVTGTIKNDDTATSAGVKKGWELTQNNTGLASFGISGSELPVYDGPFTVPSGTYITGVRFTSAVDLSQGDITIEKCLFRPTGVGRGMPLASTTNYNGNFESAKGKVVIRDSEFDGSLLSQEIAAFATGFIGIADLQNNYIHGLGTGIMLMNTGTKYDSIIEGNYVTDMVSWGDGATTGNHVDAFTIRDFTDAARPDRTAIIRNNRFDCDTSNATGAAFLQAWSGRIDNVRLEGNLLEGEGYNLILEANTNGYSNISAIDNRFTSTGWGPTYYIGGPGWVNWQDNFRFDPSMADGRGAVVRS